MLSLGRSEPRQTNHLPHPPPHIPVCTVRHQLQGSPDSGLPHARCGLRIETTQSSYLLQRGYFLAGSLFQCAKRCTRPKALTCGHPIGFLSCYCLVVIAVGFDWLVLTCSHPIGFLCSCAPPPPYRHPLPLALVPSLLVLVGRCANMRPSYWFSLGRFSTAGRARRSRS